MEKKMKTSNNFFVETFSLFSMIAFKNGSIVFL